jgi:hypothetical protein
MTIVRSPVAAARRPGDVIDHIEALEEGGADDTSQAAKDAKAASLREQASLRSSY